MTCSSSSQSLAKDGDKRFAPGNILINSRNGNVAVIIDRSTGNVVWRIGPNYPATNPFAPKIVPRPLDQISGAHDVYMIPEDRPGAGDIMIFDNQGEAGFPPVPMQVAGGSRVIEIDPVKRRSSGVFGARLGPGRLAVLQPFISSAERLPNGNTLIDEGINGRFFQVTPKARSSGNTYLRSSARRRCRLFQAIRCRYRTMPTEFRPSHMTGFRRGRRIRSDD